MLYEVNVKIHHKDYDFPSSDIDKTNTGKTQKKKINVLLCRIHIVSKPLFQINNFFF